MRFCGPDVVVTGHGRPPERREAREGRLGLEPWTLRHGLPQRRQLCCKTPRLLGEVDATQRRQRRQRVQPREQFPEPTQPRKHRAGPRPSRCVRRCTWSRGVPPPVPRTRVPARGLRRSRARAVVPRSPGQRRARACRPRPRPARTNAARRASRATRAGQHRRRAVRAARRRALASRRARRAPRERGRSWPRPQSLVAPPVARSGCFKSWRQRR